MTGFNRSIRPRALPALDAVVDRRGPTDRQIRLARIEAYFHDDVGTAAVCTAALGGSADAREIIGAALEEARR